MLKEWTDRMPEREGSKVWTEQKELALERRMQGVETALRRVIDCERAAPDGFYEAMRHFLTLRERMFPTFPADPAWKILVTLAQTPEGSGKSNITGIAHGAEVPETTALRYIAAMEVEGIIERVPHPSDGRQTLIRLTREGRRRLDAIAERWVLRVLLVLAAPIAVLGVWWG